VVSGKVGATHILWRTPTRWVPPTLRPRQVNVPIREACRPGRPRPETPRFLTIGARARRGSRSPRPSQTLDPGAVGEPFGEQSLEQVVGNIRCRGKRGGGRPRRADRTVQDCTRQIQIHQEVLVPSACPIRRLSRWHGQVTADPLERERMQNRTVNKEPAPEPAL